MDGQSAASAASVATKITLSLAPAFIAGFAVQQAVEIVSSLLAFAGKFDQLVKIKKAVLSGVSVILAACIYKYSNLNIFDPFPAFTPGPHISALLNVVFISAGTEGFNSLLKWLSYKKEDAKSSAAKNKGADDTTAGMKVMPS